MLRYRTSPEITFVSGRYSEIGFRYRIIEAEEE